MANHTPHPPPPVDVMAQLGELWISATNFAQSLMSPGWRLYQVLIILGLILLA